MWEFARSSVPIGLISLALMFAILCVMPQGYADAAVALAGAVGDNPLNTTANWSKSFTGSSGVSNGGLWVFVGDGDGSCGFSVPTVQAGGVTMTNVANLSCSQESQGFAFFLATSTVNTENITVAWGAAANGFMEVFMTSGTDQSGTLDGTSVHGSTASATSLTNSVTTASAGAMIISWLVAGGDHTGSLAASNGETNLWKSATNNPNTAGGEYVVENTPGTYTSGFSWTGATAADIFSLVIKPSVGGGGGGSSTSTSATTTTIALADFWAKFSFLLIGAFSLGFIMTVWIWRLLVTR